MNVPTGHASSVCHASSDSGDDLFWLHAPLTEVLDGQTLLIRVRTLDGGLIDDEFAVAGLNRKKFQADCRPRLLVLCPGE